MPTPAQPTTGLADARYTQLFATTLLKQEAQMVDQVLTTHPTWELFKPFAKSSTGRGLVVPVRVAKLGATGYTDDRGSHSTEPSKPLMGSITYGWCDEIITPFTLKHRDLLLNSGKEAILNLLQEYTKAAAEDHQDFMAGELWKSKESWSEGKLQNLDLLIDDEAELCGIDPTKPGKEWWASTVVESSISDESIETAFRKVLNKIYNKSRKRPTHIIAGSDIYEEFELAAEKRAGGTEPGGNTLELGFQSVKFKGIEVRLDPEAPAGTAYFIFRPALRFEYLAGEFMKAYPADRLEGKLDSTIPLASTLALGTTERRTHGKLHRVA